MYFHSFLQLIFAKFGEDALIGQLSSRFQNKYQLDIRKVCSDLLLAVVLGLEEVLLSSTNEVDVFM